jgi:hypothetical protein
MRRRDDRRRRDIEEAAAGRRQEELDVGGVVGEARQLLAELWQAADRSGSKAWPIRRPCSRTLRSSRFCFSSSAALNCQ